MTKEVTEAMYAFGACLIISAGVAIWVAISYFVPALWRRIRRLDKLLDFEDTQNKYHE